MTAPEKPPRRRATAHAITSIISMLIAGALFWLTGGRYAPPLPPVPPVPIETNSATLGR